MAKQFNGTDKERLRGNLQALEKLTKELNVSNIDSFKEKIEFRVGCIISNVERL